MLKFMISLTNLCSVFSVSTLEKYFRTLGKQTLASWPKKEVQQQKVFTWGFVTIFRAKVHKVSRSLNHISHHAVLPTTCQHIKGCFSARFISDLYLLSPWLSSFLRFACVTYSEKPWTLSEYTNLVSFRKC